MTALATTEASPLKTRDAGAEFSGGLASGQRVPESQTASGWRSSLGWNPRPTRPFLPFGELAVGDEDEPISFTGLRRENLQGGGELYAAAFRHLRPGLGRWLKRDPAGDVDGPNLYRYVHNRPTSGKDPTGLFTLVDMADPQAHHLGVQKWTNPARSRMESIRSSLIKEFEAFLEAVKDPDSTKYLGPRGDWPGWLSGGLCRLLPEDITLLETLLDEGLRESSPNPVKIFYRDDITEIGRAFRFPGTRIIRWNRLAFSTTAYGVIGQPYQLEGYVEGTLLHELTHAIQNSGKHSPFLSSDGVFYGANVTIDDGVYYNTKLTYPSEVASFWRAYIRTKR